jgi:predicted nucleotidyltransferase
MLADNIKQEIITELKTIQPNWIGVFGSYARDEENDESDIDIMIQLGDIIPSIFKFSEIQHRISNKIGKKLDLVTDEQIKNKILKKIILRDLSIIYNHEEI